MWAAAKLFNRPRELSIIPADKVKFQMIDSEVLIQSYVEDVEDGFDVVCRWRRSRRKRCCFVPQICCLRWAS